jgi:hypothetical protein
LQVAGLDMIIIDQREPPHARCCQILQSRAADAPATDHHHMGIVERHLAHAAYFGKDNVAGEAGQAFRVMRGI